MDFYATAVRSEAVQGARRTKISGASILEQYPLSYAPTDLFVQLRFAMRYKPIDVGVLAAAFEKLTREEMEKWVWSEHIGKYVRRAWYLYEMLSGKTLDVPDVPPTNNALLLDPALHVTTPGIRVRRSDRQSSGKSRLLLNDTAYRDPQYGHGTGLRSRSQEDSGGLWPIATAVE